MPRTLKNLDVMFISLVKKPANGKGLVLKGDAKPTLFELLKTDDDMMRAYGIVYTPNKEDLQGDMADAETIRKAQDVFMKEKRHQNVDTEHQFAQVPAFVAESYIVQKGDPSFPNDEGAWAVAIQVEDKALWKSLKDGDLTGISLAGTATVEPIEKGILSALEQVRKYFKIPNVEPTSNDMDEKKAFESITKSVLAKVEEKLDAKFTEFKKAAEDVDKSKELEVKFKELQKAITAIENSDKSKDLEVKFKELQKAINPTESGKEDVITKADYDALQAQIKELTVQVNKKGVDESGSSGNKEEEGFV